MFYRRPVGRGNPRRSSFGSPLTRSILAIRLPVIVRDIAPLLARRRTTPRRHRIRHRCNNRTVPARKSGCGHIRLESDSAALDWLGARLQAFDGCAEVGQRPPRALAAQPRAAVIVVLAGFFVDWQTRSRAVWRRRTRGVMHADPPIAREQNRDISPGMSDRHRFCTGRRPDGSDCRVRSSMPHGRPNTHHLACAAPHHSGVIRPGARPRARHPTPERRPAAGSSGAPLARSSRASRLPCRR